ncbi:unnamed protein product, partial [Polarella glacialis]
MADEKKAILEAEEDETNLAVDRAKVDSLERLQSVWTAAEALHAKTPRSFVVRMSRVLSKVKDRCRQPSSDRPWSDSVLARAEQERRLVVLPQEVVAQYVRMKLNNSGAKLLSDQEALSPEKSNEEEPSASSSAVPSSSLPQLHLLLLDVRPLEAYQAGHLSTALHFCPP